MLSRRTVLTTLGAAPLAFAKPNRITKADLSVLTDEVGKTPREAIDFARHYGVPWVELRSVPGLRKEYFRLPEADLRAAAQEFRDSSLKVSFLNTSMCKYLLPGAETPLRRNETPETRAKRLALDTSRYERRMPELVDAIRAAHIFEVKNVRVFAFMRTAEPERHFQRIADILGELSKLAEKEGIRLLLENETACNVATCAEMARLVKMVGSKAFGLNWDPLNGANGKEPAFPEGYNLLPKKKIWNVQVKGKSILNEPEKLDWAAIFSALAKDGYAGQVGLETHYFDGTLIEKSHLSIREMLRLVGSQVS
ncbi:MAG: sugar phosphate isomerase/epimerase [Acidobacteria bacterium]|nr:sugar phosphate isomerase/epimerase [Acidobacteriota bacterium]